jgi:hypothetical protein
MKYLSIRLDETASPDSRAAITGWQLPTGRWLVANGAGYAPLVVGDPRIEQEVLITVEPANGHHCVATCVASSSQVVVV